MAARADDCWHPLRSHRVPVETNARPIHGDVRVALVACDMVRRAMPSNTALITALILERPLCMECLKAKANLSEMEIGVALAMIQAALSVHMEEWRCRACGTIGVVIHSDRPAG
jgi:hypothetical protein